MEVLCRHALLRCCAAECCFGGGGVWNRMGYVLSGEGIVSLSIVGVLCSHVEVL